MAARNENYFAFPDNHNVFNEEKFLREVLAEFDLEAEKRNLLCFALKIQTVHRCYSQSLRGAHMLHIFQVMMSEMTILEKRRNFYLVVDLLHFILAKYFQVELAIPSIVRQLRVTLKELLEVAKNYRPFRSTKVVFLINKIRDGIGDKPYIFLKLLSSEDLEFILGCFNRMSSHDWNIKTSRILMTDLVMKKENSYTLLFNGFPYGFDKKYFTDCYLDLMRTKVRGKSFRDLISPRILFTESSSEYRNLRLQMALEILVTIFNRNKTYTIPLIKSIWKSVPWPLISVAEMYDLLKHFCIGEDLKIQDVCDEYVARNPVFEVPSTPRPRSLRDLASVQVRQNLSDTRSLRCDAIDRQEIPKTLHDYLKLDSCHLPK